MESIENDFFTLEDMGPVVFDIGSQEETDNQIRIFNKVYPDMPDRKYMKLKRTWIKYRSDRKLHNQVIEYCMERDLDENPFITKLKQFKPPQLYHMTISPKNAETAPLVLIGKMREVLNKKMICRGIYTIERFGLKGERNHIHFIYEGEKVDRTKIVRIFKDKINFKLTKYNSWQNWIKYIRDPDDKNNDGKKERKKADAVWRDENNIKEFIESWQKAYFL